MRRRATLGCLGILGMIGCGTYTAGVCDYQGACDQGDGGVGSETSVLDGGKDGTPPGCDASVDPKDSLACLDDTFGIFVSASALDDMGDGSKAHPVQKIGTALSKVSASKTRLYLCEGMYAEDVVIDASHDGVSLYGGWKCADWSYGGAKPVIGAGAIPLKLDSLTKPVVIEDVDVDAADQSAVPGGSSIAAFVNASAGVTFSRVKLQAGAGGAGANGVLAPFTFSAAATLIGHDASGASGGTENSQVCPGAMVTKGGKGGDNGFGGDPGTPALGGGLGGVLAACNAGGGGGDGTPAVAAADSDGAKLVGTLSPTGWLPAAGKSGSVGGPGQGGGGGLGAGGGGGGGGGAGGCGGAGGAAGKGGGGSFALVSTNSVVSLSSSVLVAKNAGAGGTGTPGQIGQAPGGAGGNRTATACLGGNGGSGGSGGAGGGGAGGPSVAVLYSSTSMTAPLIDDATKAAMTTGTAGASGHGGKPGINDGKPGVKANVQDATTL